MAQQLLFYDVCLLKWQIFSSQMGSTHMHYSAIMLLFSFSFFFSCFAESNLCQLGQQSPYSLAECYETHFAVTPCILARIFKYKFSLLLHKHNFRTLYINSIISWRPTLTANCKASSLWQHNACLKELQCKHFMLLVFISLIHSYTRTMYMVCAAWLS